MAKPLSAAVPALLAIVWCATVARSADESPPEQIDPVAVEAFREPLFAPSPDMPDHRGRREPLIAPEPGGKAESVVAAPDSTRDAPGETPRHVAAAPEAVDAHDVARVPRFVGHLLEQAIAMSAPVSPSAWDGEEATGGAWETRLVIMGEDRTDEVIAQFFEENIATFEWALWLTPTQAWFELSLAAHGIDPLDVPLGSEPISADQLVTHPSVVWGAIFPDEPEVTREFQLDDTGYQQWLSYWEDIEWMGFSLQLSPEKATEDASAEPWANGYPEVRPRIEDEAALPAVDHPAKARRYHRFPAYIGRWHADISARPDGDELDFEITGYRRWGAIVAEEPWRVPEEYLTMLALVESVGPRTWREMFFPRHHHHRPRNSASAGR